MTPQLTSVDSAFFHLESHDTPMHVAGLQVFSLPAGAAPDFVQQLVGDLRRPTRLASPWNLKLHAGPLGRRWQIDHDVDMDYHVRHLALPHPGGERELGVLISRLHSHRLNRRRPLWECHVIEGLEHGRFAVYTKIHHALADGVTTLRLLTEPLAHDADAPMRAPWTADPETRSVQGAPADRKVLDTVRAQASALRPLSKALGRVARSALGGDDALTLPFTAPRSVLNGPVTGQRRYATQQVEVARIKRLGKATDTTLNDVVLALCSAGLRRFLKEANALPGKPLIAAVPASLRAPGDTSTANAVSIMFAALGTDIADPAERLQHISASTRRAKAHLMTIPKASHGLYNGLLMTPFVLQVISGFASRSRPYFNVTVSNVPGPSRPLYLRGARMEAFYPVSITAHGQAVNITCTSYNGMLNFGIAGCRDALPHLQRLAVYIGEALPELESAAGLSAEPSQTLRAPRRAAA